MISYSRSHDAVIHVYDDAGTVIEAHEHVISCIVNANHSAAWVLLHSF
jgi:hypothetical protein